MTRHRISVAACALLSGVVGGFTHAEDFASGAYREMCLAMCVDFTGDSASLPRELAFRVQSTLPAVKPDDIQLTLMRGDDAYSIPVSSDGAFSLPVSKALFDANARLVWNQPKGTLRIAGVPLVDPADVRVPLAAHLDRGRLDYATLCKLSIERRQQVIQKFTQQGNANDKSRKVGEGDGQWYLVLRASENMDSAEATVVDDSTQAATGPLRSRVRKMFGPSVPLKKVSAGQFRIPYSESLREQNPVISLSPDSSWSCEILVVVEKPE